MNARCWLIVTICGAFSLIANGATGPALNDPIEGQELAREVCSMAPATNAEFKGVLVVVRRGEEERQVPVQSKVVLLRAEAWQSIYHAQPQNGPAESVVIRHSGSAPVYIYSRGTETNFFAGEMATNSFAASDFALLDLGAEFFHWPVQILLTREMRKGRGCDVLESRPATTNYYSRVVSWIDQESRGLLMAEAYDTQGRLLKQFEVEGLKKVGGRWHVQEMELRNRQTKSKTRLQFQFDEH